MPRTTIVHITTPVSISLPWSLLVSLVRGPFRYDYLVLTPSFNDRNPYPDHVCRSHHHGAAYHTLSFNLLYLHHHDHAHLWGHPNRIHSD